MTKISRFVIWICSKFTKTEIEQIVKELTDILNDRNPEVKPKDDFKEKHPNYRNFYVDPNPPLTEPKLKLPRLNWEHLLDNYLKKFGKPLKPVNPKKLTNKVPSDCVCRTCGGPADYLYYNDGKKRSQLKCKICNSFSPIHPRRIYKGKYFCHYCGSPLQLWKRRSYFDIYRCVNDKCPHYISAKNKLNAAEKILFRLKPFQFKLRYQTREYHLSNELLRLSSPQKPTINPISNIRNSLNTFALVLTLHISFAISARKTALLMSKVFQIPMSYQTVLNYCQYAAYYCHKFNLFYKAKVDDYIVGDEDYIKISGKNYYAFFFLSSESRAVISYHIHNTRDTLPAIVSLNEAIRTAKPDQHITAVTDGNPSYTAAILHINRSRPDNPITHKTVVGLQNLDSESEEFRHFKQIVERFGRTYKYHVKPANGFNIFNGAISTTVLFVTHYNFLRPHMALNYSVPLPLPELKNITTIQGQWAKILTMASKL